jgi:hypothetical protein
MQGLLRLKKTRVRCDTNASVDAAQHAAMQAEAQQHGRVTMSCRVPHSSRGMPIMRCSRRGWSLSSHVVLPGDPLLIDTCRQVA